MDEAHMESIMNALGYVKTQNKITQKLVYYLWVRKSSLQSPMRSFKKAEIRSGHSRNNFAVVLPGSSN